MCGILLLIQVQNQQPLYYPSILEANKRRGPDAQDEYKLNININNKTIEILFYGFVLHLRGDNVVKQPIVNDRGDVLCFNGEIFGGLKVNEHENDAVVLFNELSKLENENEIIELLDQLQGPHAIVYYKKSLNTVYFGRDKLGIRSLLKLENEDNFICLTSVSTPLLFEQKEIEDDTKEVEVGVYSEIETKRFFKLQFDQYFDDLKSLIQPIIRPSHGENIDLAEYLKINDVIPQTLEKDILSDNDLFLNDIIENNHIILDEFYDKLNQSVYKRVITIPPKQNKNDGSRIAILFSGGIDCTILTYLVDQHLPKDESIDLLNVAFENPRTKNINFNVPDRKTGLESYEELKLLCPNRTFNFVKIDIPYSEVQLHQSRIKYLIHPSDTIMDLSIALAFWFSARGSGYIDNNGERIEYTTKAKVLISGLGADEQLGGYSRHRTAFEMGSWERLINEVQLDVSRINLRNLGRDDRVCTDWSKEVRYPFLDIELMNYLNQLSIKDKMDLRYPRGLGEKAILRALAKKLGFKILPRLFKRAVQFGSRTAKMLPSDSQTKGHDKI
ncbi:hypothetical protein K502DRAFT_365425 [Neoconidiobolus thromboides FSU 785]|nr:hypothetical protein K502DRAFT_365425 [Neoconidiobolus thromboides FSU 785]